MVKRKIVFRRKKKENRLGMLMVTVTVLMLLVVVSIKSAQLYQKLEANRLRVAQLEEQLQKEQERTVEIEEYGKYTRTKKFVEEVAKDKLGLVYEGEIIFKAED